MTVAIVLQALTLVALVGRGGPSPASAQVPDAGAQRERQIDELKRVAERLDRIAAILESGKLEVRVSKTDSR
jgi:hypothetical protein